MRNEELEIGGIEFIKFCDIVFDSNLIKTSNEVVHAEPKLVYAILIDGEVVYIGKAANGLRKRIYGYCNPLASQATNLKMNKIITDCIVQKRQASIYALKKKAQVSFNGELIDLSASLEEHLIQKVRPKYNQTNNRVKKATPSNLKMVDVL